MKLKINDFVIVTPQVENSSYLVGQEFSARIIDTVGDFYIVKDRDDDVFQVAEDEVELNIDNLKSFTIVNDNDGNDSFEILATNSHDAAHKALEYLGYWVAKES